MTVFILQGLEYVPGSPEAPNGSNDWQDDLVGEGTCHQTWQASSIPRTHMVERTNSLKLTSHLHKGAVLCMCMHTYTSPQK